MPDIGFVNGRFMPLGEAAIPVEDRGYQFGDGIYEVLRTYRGVPFQLEAHLKRLERSAAALHLTLPFQTAQWSACIKEGLRLAGYRDCKVYIQVTRGVAPRDHQIPDALAPTVVMTFREMVELERRCREEGVEAITVEDHRWGRCDIKSINLLPNVLAKRQARAGGAFEAIFVWHGEVTEGAVANVMAAKGGQLATPPEGPRILSGVTRALVLDLARNEGLAVRERRMTVEDLTTADEVFLTGTTVEVLPVVRIDHALVSAGKPGKVARLLGARFRTLVG